MSSLILEYDDLDFTNTVEQWEDSAPKRINIMAVPKRHGGLVQEVPVSDARRISISGKIQEQDAITCRTTLDNFSTAFGRFNKKLRMWSDKFVYAYPLGFNYKFVDGTAAASAVYTVDFVCADPFYYYDSTGSDSHTLNSSDTSVGGGLYKEAFTINNTGTVFAYPVITITATNTLTTVTVRNLTTGRNFTYTGTVSAGKQLVIDCGYFTVTNDGNDDLTNWNGSFLWFNPGNNSMEIEGSVTATYAFAWNPRTF